MIHEGATAVAERVREGGVGCAALAKQQPVQPPSEANEPLTCRFVRAGAGTRTRNRPDYKTGNLGVSYPNDRRRSASSPRPAFSTSETGEIICESGRRRLRMDIAKLDGLQLFDGLSAQQREMVANYAVEVDVPEGKVLLRDSALAWDFYVIEEGSADVRRGQKILATLGAGDFFGEMGAMASDRRRTASVVATSPMKAIMLTHQLRRIADESPDITERLRTAIADREQRLL